MSKKEKIRLGFIGCGSIAGKHLKDFSQIKGVSLVGLADANREAAKEFKEKAISYGYQDEIEIFANHEDMLAGMDLDAVGIFSPHAYHASQVKDCLKANLHVLVEKPMVIKPAEAQEVLKLEQETNRKVSISYDRCSYPIFRWAKSFLKEGNLGEIHFVSIVLAQNTLLGFTNMKTWRAQPHLSGGGFLMDTGSHLVDILFWLTDLKPKEVFAYIQNKGAKVDILTSLAIKFSSGALATFAAVGDSQDWHEDIIIWGKKGKLCFPWDSFTYQNVYYVLEDDQVRKPDHLPPSSNPDLNFIRAIKGKEPIASPSLYGLRVAELTQATYESARTKKPVKII